MNSIFNQMLDKTTRLAMDQLAKTIAKMSPFEQDRAISRLDEQQQFELGIVVADRVRGHSTLSSLETGALLKVFELTTSEASRAEWFAIMEQETGIKRTQLYRLIAMFDCFGKVLLNEPEVATRCTCEALKILSEKNVSAETREQALSFVRDGNFLTIKAAKKFRSEQSKSSSVAQSILPVTVATRREATPKRVVGHEKPTDAFWKFSDPNLVVIVQHTPGAPPIGAEEVIIGLESALAKARQEYVTTKQEPQLI